MDERDFNFQDLQEQLKESTGYMVGITFLKNGILTHHFMTNNFPTGDIKTSINELRKLALDAAKPKAIESINETKE